MWKEIRSGVEATSKVDSENMNAFLKLNKTTLKQGALDSKTERIISAAIALATNSEYCIVGRVRGVFEAGAARQELIEVSAVARLMGGSLVLGNSVTLFQETINTFAADFDK